MLGNGSEEEAATRVANPFGYIDHSRFSGFGVDLAYGRLSNGAYLHISESPRGLACNCVCPACGKQLIAKRGPEKAEHFAHRGEGCGRGAETNAHIWAKEILAAALRIKLPTVRASAGYATREVRKADFFTFKTAHLEKRLGDIVPDVILTTKNGKELLVEIRVTHRCGPEKIEKLQRDRLASIEVDLHHLRECENAHTIANALLETAPRVWLFNERQEQESEKLRLELSAAKEREERRKREASERQAAALRKRVEAVLSIARIARRLASGKVPPAFDRFLDRDFDERVGIQTKGEGFTVSPFLWQSTIQERFLLPSIALTYEHGGLTVRTVMSGIADCVHPSFRSEPPKDLREAVKAACPGFRFPDEAIADYLNQLFQRGQLDQCGNGEYALQQDQAEWLHSEERRRRAEEKRRGLLESSLHNILALVPLEEQERFSIDYWLEQKVEGLDLTAETMVADGGEEWKSFHQSLLVIEKMLGGGDPVELTLGLPIAEANARATTRQQARVAGEQELRRCKLRAEANRLLQGYADEWCSGHFPDWDRSIMEFAAVSDENLHRVLGRLRLISDERRAKAQQEAEAASCRESLRVSVEAIYNPERAALWLRNVHKQLGASPWDHCTDQAGLARCTGLLPRKVQKHEARRMW